MAGESAHFSKARAAATKVGRSVRTDEKSISHVFQKTKMGRMMSSASYRDRPLVGSMRLTVVAGSLNGGVEVGEVRSLLVGEHAELVGDARGEHLAETGLDEVGDAELLETLGVVGGLES
jgi:hypothetical protein